MKKAEAMVKEIAEKYESVFLPLHDMLNEAVKGEDYGMITTDGTHLTEEGARIIAEKRLDATANWLDKCGEIS